MQTPTNRDAAPGDPQILYLTQETRAVLRRLCESLGQQLEPEQITKLQTAADTYFERIQAIFAETFPAIAAYPEEQITAELEQALTEELNQLPGAAVIRFDRYFLSESQLADSYTFEFARKADGTKTPRQGSASIAEQLTQLKEQIGARPVIAIDDGAFTGGSLRYGIGELVAAGIRVEKVVTFLGNPAVTNIAIAEAESVPVRFVRPLENMIDWVDGRDAGIAAGGRPTNYSRRNKVAQAKGYMAPFSDGSGASLNASPDLIPTSRALLQAEDTLLGTVEAVINKELRIKDMLRAGFPLPYSPDLPKNSLNSPFRAIYRQAIQRLDSLTSLLNPRPAELVLDMDGTLYSLDGEGGGFRGSTLARLVAENAIQLIQTCESCSQDQAEAIWAACTESQNGLPSSAILSRKYGMSREEFLEAVWGPIDPARVIRNTNNSKPVVEYLKEKDIKITLLTAAPRVWADKVVDFLGLASQLDRAFTTEDFISKAEIFQQIAAEYRDPASVISVGDQYRSDIEPALAAGMRALQITESTPLNYLFAIR